LRHLILHTAYYSDDFLDGFSGLASNNPDWWGRLDGSVGVYPCSTDYSGGYAILGWAISRIHARRALTGEAALGVRWVLEVYMRQPGLAPAVLVWRGTKHGGSSNAGQYALQPPPDGHVGFFATSPVTWTLMPPCGIGIA
jgi:hypothetical protein